MKHFVGNIKAQLFSLSATVWQPQPLWDPWPTLSPWAPRPRPPWALRSPQPPRFGLRRWVRHKHLNHCLVSKWFDHFLDKFNLLILFSFDFLWLERFNFQATSFRASIVSTFKQLRFWINSTTVWFRSIFCHLNMMQPCNSVLLARFYFCFNLFLLLFRWFRLSYCTL